MSVIAPPIVAQTAGLKDRLRSTDPTDRARVCKHARGTIHWRMPLRRNSRGLTISAQRLFTFRFAPTKETAQASAMVVALIAALGIANGFLAPHFGGTVAGA